MIVVDASVLVAALADDGPVGGVARAELSHDAHWTVPDHCVAEVFSALRGLWLGRQISPARAESALEALEPFELDVVPTQGLLARMWELRHDVSGYDAAYLALAEASACPLVTADARLVRVPEARCEIRLALPA
ncbi:type II toxin-antitoxin system VapC family toxin [Ornithinimicrobium cavernae]|uniref:type II toxin-antitoxin system VapC family toxin n=1 Tax=Ornithinimicrobium cavernae TaxID=2666047 RepID=UPI000D69E41A|nr:type II toxin-antitoxin system VapC family toxin [Ornithinimicrobium cavernae]